MGVICVESCVSGIHLGFGEGWGQRAAIEGRWADLSPTKLFGGVLFRRNLFPVWWFSFVPYTKPHHILPSLLGAGVTLEIGENMAGADSVFWASFCFDPVCLGFFFFSILLFSSALCCFNRELVSWATKIARSQNCLTDRLLLFFLELFFALHRVLGGLCLYLFSPQSTSYIHTTCLLLYLLNQGRLP